MVSKEKKSTLYDQVPINPKTEVNHHNMVNGQSHLSTGMHSKKKATKESVPVKPDAQLPQALKYQQSSNSYSAVPLSSARMFSHKFSSKLLGSRKKIRKEHSNMSRRFREESLVLMPTIWGKMFTGRSTNIFSENTATRPSGGGDKQRRANLLSPATFEPTEQSTAELVPSNLCFPLRLVLRFWIRLVNLTLDIIVLVLAAQEKEGIRSWVFWLLLGLQFLPLPILLAVPWTQKGVVVLRILHLSSFLELKRSWKTGEWTDELLLVDAVEAFLTTLPSAIVQLIILLVQVDGCNLTRLIILLAASFSLLSAASAMHGVDFFVFGISLNSCGMLFLSLFFYMYCMIDVTVSTFFLSMCVDYFLTTVYHIPWGCSLIVFRYISRVFLHIGIYIKRGSIRRGGSSDWYEMLAFATLVSGPIQLLSDLPFLHEVALQGALWLLTLQVLSTLELSAMLFCIYEDEDNVLNGDFVYVLVCVASLQLVKLLLGTMKTYPEQSYEGYKKDVTDRIQQSSNVNGDLDMVIVECTEMEDGLIQPATTTEF